MRKCDNYFALHCCRYAPEQFKAYRVVGFSNGNRNIPQYEEIFLNSSEKSACGNAFICKGRSFALAELKKILRTRDKKRKRLVTYGFFEEGSNKTFHFTQQLTASDNDIFAKLYAFKEFKDHLIKHDCIVETWSEAKLDGNYKPESVKETYTKVDLSRPKKIYFRTPTVWECS